MAIGLVLVAALFIVLPEIGYDASHFSFSIPMGGTSALWNSTVYSPLFWTLAVLVFGAGVYFATHLRFLN